MELPKVAGAAGAAFLLQTSSSEDAVMHRPAGIVRLRAGAPYVTVELHTSLASVDLRITAWDVVQEALDVYSAKFRQALATYRGEHEHLLWSQSNNGYKLTVVETSHARWGVGGTVAVDSSSGAAAPAPRQAPILPHHPALRFLRMSQLSEDLFDAYRNAYLALECLVSDASPKASSEAEADWLLRVLGGPLANAVPSQISDLRLAVRRIYQDARLPLFHAKTGQSFQLPHGSERSEIQDTLGLLNSLLISMVHHKLGPEFPVLWASESQRVRDAMARAVLKADEVLFIGTSGRKSVRPALEIYDKPRRFGQPWAALEMPTPRCLDDFKSLDLRVNGQHWTALKPLETVPLQGVHTVRLELNLLVSSKKAPTPLHPR